MNFIGTKKLETSRLILRPTEESDLKTLWELLLIPEVNKYYLCCKISTNWEDEIKWQHKKLARANDNDVFQWSIILKETGECIGQISVQEGETDDKSIRDIGWFINPSYQRLGLSTEAAECILDYMFNEVKINKIITSAAIINPASWKLMEKLGFVRTDKTKYNKYTFVEGEVKSYIYEYDGPNK